MRPAALPLKRPLEVAGRALLEHRIHTYPYWESVAGSVIQATGIVKFEDGLLIGNQLKARNGLQMVDTIPGVKPGVVRTPRFLQRQTQFQSACVRMAAWC